MRFVAAFIAILAGAQLLAAQANAADVYSTRCAMCHAADGAGVPGIYPRLRDRAAQMAGTEQGRNYLMQVVLYGMSGPITVDDVPIDGIMPAFAELTDEQVADVINYIGSQLRSQKGEDVLPVGAQDVQHLRQRALTPTQVHKQRVTALQAAANNRMSNSSFLSGALEDYTRSCQGCHREDGCTDPLITPPLRNSVGVFPRSEEGRRYLVQVPGVALSSLDDMRLARVLNWTLLVFSSEQLPKDFVPYDSIEVSRLRREVLPALEGVRSRLLASVADSGIAGCVPDGKLPAAALKVRL